MAVDDSLEAHEAGLAMVATRECIHAIFLNYILMSF
jgi:hypothetical protein